MHIELIACLCLAGAPTTQENTAEEVQEHQILHAPQASEENRSKNLGAPDESMVASRPERETPPDYKVLFTVVLVAVAVSTAFIGILTYKHVKTTRRIDQFLEMRKRYSESQAIRDVCAALAKGDPDEVRELDYFKKRYFLGLFEEIAILVHSGILDKNVTLYMFGYFAILCLENDEFWRATGDGTIGTIQKNQKAWALFESFAEEMKELSKTFVLDVSMFDFRKPVPIKKSQEYHDDTGDSSGDRKEDSGAF